MYLTQGLHRSLQRHPRKKALSHLVDDRFRSLDFVELLDQVGRRAAALRARGLAQGDRIAIVSPNNDQMVLTLLACWWIGAIACPMNLRWSAPELAFALADCGAALLVLDDGNAGAAAELDGSLPSVRFGALATESAGFEPIEDARIGGDALAVILYTGGTTGRSKGVMLSHANFWSACMARGAELNNDAGSVSLLVAPMFHVAGLGRMIGQSIVGGGCVTLPVFRPEMVLAAIERLAITDIIVVPTMLQGLLDSPAFDASRVQSLQRIAFGAAPMPCDLLQRALDAWPRAEFWQAYGMTETAGAVCINLPGNHRPGAGGVQRLDTVGRAGLGAEIRIVDAAGQECPRGEDGEIVLRGPMVTAGYWQLPELTAQALRDGWLHTGDGGRMDEDGYIRLTDRLKDMIISGGENVYSGEVEAALRAHPAVSEAAVIGVPDARWGEAVHAVIVLRPDAARSDDAEALGEALQAWCRTRLAGYKCPRSLSYAPALPLSAAGKVLKTTLRANHRSATATP